VSAEAPVCVAIDDLDVDEQGAQLRGILDALGQAGFVPRCHYIIALPDTGIPEVFIGGKAFAYILDTIRLQPLSLREARHLLELRGGGASVALAAFSNCLAGGTPRDLVRISAAIEAKQADSIDTDLPSAAERVVRQEASRATEVAISKLRVMRTPEARRLLSWSLDVNIGSATAKDVVAYCQLLSTVSSESDALTSADYDAHEMVARLAADYYRYATILEVFGPGSDPDRTPVVANADLGKDHALDTLASARRLAHLDPAAAWERISQCRRAWRLEVAAPPRSLLGS
jgi:hypothetical protein